MIHVCDLCVHVYTAMFSATMIGGIRRFHPLSRYNRINAPLSTLNSGLLMRIQHVSDLGDSIVFSGALVYETLGNTVFDYNAMVIKL